MMGKLAVIVVLVVLVAMVAGCSRKAEPTSPWAWAEDGSTFIRDVNYQDGTVVPAGSEITKKWEVLNSGQVYWKERWLWCEQNADGFEMEDRVRVPDTAPGQTATIGVQMKVSEEPGYYRLSWKMYTSDGKVCFPDLQGLFLEIEVKGVKQEVS